MKGSGIKDSFDIDAIKTVKSKSDLPSEQELDEKMGAIDILVPIHGVTDMDTIKELIEDLENKTEGKLNPTDFKIVYIHRYLAENITTFGLKEIKRG